MNELWPAVRAFTTLLETKSAGGTFEEWFAEIWGPYQQRCRAIAANKFITKMALQEFQLINPDVFDNQIEYERLLKHCNTVNIDSHDYMEIAWPFYRDQCIRLM